MHFDAVSVCKNNEITIKKQKTVAKNALFVLFVGLFSRRDTVWDRIPCAARPAFAARALFFRQNRVRFRQDMARFSARPGTFSAKPGTFCGKARALFFRQNRAWAGLAFGVRPGKIWHGANRQDTRLGFFRQGGYLSLPFSLPSAIMRLSRGFAVLLPGFCA